MPREIVEAPVSRHWIAATITAVVATSVTIYAAVAAVAIDRVAAARPFALLAVRSAHSTEALQALRQWQINTALTGNPLDQRLFNVAMVRDIDRAGPERIAPWAQVISRLGWRDTTSLQNRLYVAAQNNDLSTAIDVVDALLRRRKLTDEIVAALSSVESDPPSRAILVDRLVKQPSWRGVYLTTTAQLQTTEQLLARYELLSAMRQRGSPITANEAALNIIALERAGLHDRGFELWRSVHPTLSRPLDDTSFVTAGANLRQGIDETPIPYQWQILIGEGFRADVTEDAGATTLDIDWDGRGVPVFAQQRLSGASGMYALQLNISGATMADLPAFDFRLVCDGAAITLRPQAAASQRYVTERPVLCDYPLFQISGGILGGATQRQLSIRSIALSRPSSARTPG